MRGPACWCIVFWLVVVYLSEEKKADSGFICPKGVEKSKKSRTTRRGETFYYKGILLYLQGDSK